MEFHCAACCRVLFFQIVDHIAILFEMVGFFVLGDGAVFDGLCGAVSDACHAVCALISPDGFSIHKVDVVERTELLAFSASHAGVRHIKVLCGELIFAPDRVEGDGDDRLEKIYVSGDQIAAGENVGSYLIQLMVCFGDPIFNLVFFQHGIGFVDDIVSGHFELGVSAVDHALGFEDRFGQNTGDAAIAAAGENKIDIFASCKFLFFQIFAHKHRHFADVDRCADDKRFFGIKRNVIVHFYTIEKIDTFVIQTFRKFFGNKFCVAGCGKI